MNFQMFMKFKKCLWIKKKSSYFKFVCLFPEINDFFKKKNARLSFLNQEVTTTSTRRWTWRKKHELGSGCHSDQPHYYKDLACQTWPTRTLQLSALLPHCCGDRFDGHINYLSRYFSWKNLSRCNARAYVLVYI